MKKIFGYLAHYLLLVIGTTILAPTLFGGVCLLWASRLICWAKNKHTYAANFLLLGGFIDNLTCTICGHKISTDQEKEEVRNDYFKIVEKMKATKDYLNEAFKTPEEKAAEEVIEDSKHGLN